MNQPAATAARPADVVILENTHRPPSGLRGGLTAGWLAGSAAWCVVVGVTTDRALLTMWIMAGLLAVTVGTPKARTLLIDWSPFLLFYVAYENIRGFAFTLGRPTVWHLPIEIDRWVGGGSLPSVSLQEHLLQAHSGLSWWELPLALVYFSHFYACFLVAGVLWWRSRATYRAFILRLGAVLGVTVLCYVVAPSAPPWAAARCSSEQVVSQPVHPPCMDRSPDRGQQTLAGPIEPTRADNPDHLQRLTGRGLELVPGTKHMVGGAIGLGLNLANPMAAVPSLHAACSALLSAFSWRRTRRRWRPLLAAYPVVMGFALVWSADHYVFDVLAGWALVGLVMVGGWALARRRSASRMPGGLDTGPVHA